MDDQQPLEGSALSELFGSRKALPYLWMGVGVLLLLVLIEGSALISHDSRIARLEQASWQSVGWGQGAPAGATSGGRVAAGGQGGASGGAERKPYSERKAAREQEATLARLDTFILENEVELEQAGALKTLVQACLDETDLIRRDGEGVDVRAAVRAVVERSRVDAAALIGEELSQTLATDVLHKRRSQGEGGGGGRQATEPSP